MFSGAGGLDIGVEQAGFEVACAVETDKYACETLRGNRRLASMDPANFDAWFDPIEERQYRRWPRDKRDRERQRVRSACGALPYLKGTEVLEGDIRSVSTERIARAAMIDGPGELDLVVGGPPCQTFSRAGKGQTVNDDRGQLFLEFCRVVEELRPRWFLFENVKGLAQTKTDLWQLECDGCGLAQIPRFDPARAPILGGSRGVSCDRCGSTTSWLLERAKRGGALDIILGEFRRIGYETTTVLLDSADYGVPQRRERLFVIGTRDAEGFSLPRPSHVDPHSTQDLDAEHPSYRTVWETLFSEPNADHAWPLDLDEAVLWVKNVVRPHDEPVTWDLRRPSPTIGAHQGAKLAIAPVGVPKAQLERQRWHSRGRRQGDSPPVPVVHSYLSDRDLLLLQTFPRAWFIAGTRMERAFQIGNAVPPAFGRAVASGILRGVGTQWVEREVPRSMSRATARRRKGSAPRLESEGLA